MPPISEVQEDNSKGPRDGKLPRPALGEVPCRQASWANPGRGPLEAGFLGQSWEGTTRTVDGEMHPAAIVECVILLVQHEHFAFIPALVLGAHLLQP